MIKELISRFKQIYELERFQIAFYNAQLSSTEDRFYHLAFSRLVETEKKHAAYFAKQLAKGGISVPKVGEALASAAGTVLGESLERTGETMTCKTGAQIGKKLLQAYHQLLEFLEENDYKQDLQEELLPILLEQEFHTLWLQDYAKRVEQAECRRNVLAEETPGDHPTVNVNMHLI